MSISDSSRSIGRGRYGDRGTSELRSRFPGDRSAPPAFPEPEWENGGNNRREKETGDRTGEEGNSTILMLMDHHSLDEMARQYWRHSNWQLVLFIRKMRKRGTDRPAVPGRMKPEGAEGSCQFTSCYRESQIFFTGMQRDIFRGEI